MEKEIKELDYDLVEEFEDISYGFDGHYCIDLDEIEVVFEENEIKNDSPAELLARYFQSKGYGNIKQAVKEFAEKLKEVFNTKHSAVIANVARNRVDELIKELYGEN